MNRLALICALLSLSACFEKEPPEYRLRTERGRNKLNIHDDLLENDGYHKYRDRLWRKHHIEDQQKRQEEQSRQRRAAAGIKDGTLIERFMLKKEDLPPEE